MPINYEEDSKPKVTNDQLQEIAKLAGQMAKFERVLSDAEDAVKKAKADLKRVQERELPDAMRGCGLTGFTLETGESLIIKEDLFASIPKKNKAAAAKWLTEHQLGALVKEDVGIGFEKGETERVNQLIEILEANGFNNHTISENINTASVKSAIKELQAEGEDVPLELFGAYWLTRAIIKA